MFPHESKSRHHRLPEVAEQEPQVQKPGPHTGKSDLQDFKTMVKRNLRPQSPPADLLARIQERIEEIKSEQ